MIDLTRGPLAHHIASISLKLLFTLVIQFMNPIFTLYFVSELGAAATAGVTAASNILIAISTLTLVLSIGTASLAAQAAGRHDSAGIHTIFNQSMGLAIFSGVASICLSWFLARPYLELVVTDTATVHAGMEYLLWALPGVALTFLWTVLSSALQGLGMLRPLMLFSACSVGASAVLSPILISGWATGTPLGIKGAGLTTTLATGISLLVTRGCIRRSTNLIFDPKTMRPRLRCWSQILYVGAPVGAELILLFLSTSVIYYAIRGLGAPAQAALGVGTPIFQVLLLPVMAITSAIRPIIGQNFGARLFQRVVRTHEIAVCLTIGFMVLLTCLLQWHARTMVDFFQFDEETKGVAARFLELRSWGLVAHGLVLINATMFQALGNTTPSLATSVVRFLAFSAPALLASAQPSFHIEQIWYLWTASAVLQAALSSWLLRSELGRRMPRGEATVG